MLTRCVRQLKPIVPIEGYNLSESLDITVDPYELHNIKAEDGPPIQLSLKRGQLLEMYANMVLMRQMEVAADSLYKRKLIRGFCHLNTGQEAVAVGTEAAIDNADSVITAYRCHGFTMVRGGTVHSILAELLGRGTGITKGKGGSMHMFANEFYGGNGIVGAQVPLGAGIAFKHKYSKTNQFCISLYGDGAANQGQIFEAYNMAQLWKLPCAFVCENNRYGMGTAANRASASFDYYTRGDYIPGIKVNGMDVLSVYAAMQHAKTFCTTKGPLVMEMETYRYGGHSMSDPGTTYRTREEIQNMRSRRDPINSIKHRLIEAEQPESDLKQIDKLAKEHVMAAVQQAEKDPEPHMDELFKDIYTHPVTMRLTTK